MWESRWETKVEVNPDPKRTAEGRECSDFDWSKSGIGSYTVEEWRKTNEFDFFLAAGNSTRFGSNKLLYRLNGKCMYRYGLEVVAALWQKGLLDTIVIVTQYEEIIYDIEAHFPYMKTVNNPHPEAGISGSIRLGGGKAHRIGRKCGKQAAERGGRLYVCSGRPAISDKRIT